MAHPWFCQGLPSGVRTLNDECLRLKVSILASARPCHLALKLNLACRCRACRMLSGCRHEAGCAAECAACTLPRTCCASAQASMSSPVRRAWTGPDICPRAVPLRFAMHESVAGLCHACSCKYGVTQLFMAMCSQAQSSRRAQMRRSHELCVKPCTCPRAGRQCMPEGLASAGAVLACTPDTRQCMWHIAAPVTCCMHCCACGISMSMSRHR